MGFDNCSMCLFLIGMGICVSFDGCFFDKDDSFLGNVGFCGFLFCFGVDYNMFGFLVFDIGFRFGMISFSFSNMSLCFFEICFSFNGMGLNGCNCSLMCTSMSFRLGILSLRFCLSSNISLFLGLFLNLIGGAWLSCGFLFNLSL